MSIPLSAGATLHPLEVPTRADAAEAGGFGELAHVRNTIYRQITGRDEQDLTAAQLLPVLRSRPERSTRLWLVRLGDEAVGRAVIDIPHEPGSRVAIVTVELLPRVWGLGIARAILPHVETVAREHGRTVLQNWSEQPVTDGPRLDSPTGYGSVPDDHTARFLRRSGFRLEQVYRVSHLALGDEALARAQTQFDTAAAVASDYRTIRWTLPTPAEHLDGYAWAKSRMSTDAPSAGLTTDEERWDCDRVRRMEDRFRQMGQRVQVTAAVHIPTGRIAAFTELGIGADPVGTTHQHDTLVLREHRGHRLGLLIKSAALLSWADEAPHSPRVITYNAEENAPMLSINEALGFTASAYEGAWKKELR